MDLKQTLNQIKYGAALVKFEKKDGSIRELYGTQNLDVVAVIRPLQVPTGSDKTKPADLVTIFDIENEGWRSFRHGQFISAEKVDLPDMDVTERMMEDA